ncbi:ABC transporter permease [Deinococcus sp. RL]|uniref:ABC transporter permease n=1 Tax=Deinococcus sp. RL TaxID=1489678 RepID=UPI0004D34D88|nr:ABC transporter permease [Deinococcus sp. RL]KEF34117.1 ABC transporter permease [Deinococcus sp. RL]
MSRPAQPSGSGGAAPLVALGAALLLVSLALPWLELRPNRLAAGERLYPGVWAGVGAALAGGLLLAARRPRPALALASLALLGGLAALGQGSAAALAGEPPLSLARVAAGGGWWLWMAGAGVALWGAAAAGRLRGWAWAWLPPALLYVLLGGLSSWSVWQEGRAEADRLAQELFQHLRLTGIALAIAAVLGGPLAVWAVRRPRAGAVVLAVAGAIQTLPSLALLGLLIVPLGALSQAVPALRALGVSGIGPAPALVALTLYALLPVIRNGVVALEGVDAGTLDAGRGMGMTPGQLFWRVQLPLALPVWLAGIRQATVLLIGVTAVAALVGAGGLGVYIFRGLNASATDLILLGALPACLLALLADALWRGAESALTRRLGLGRGAEVT